MIQDSNHPAPVPRAPIPERSLEASELCKIVPELASVASASGESMGSLRLCAGRLRCLHARFLQQELTKASSHSLRSMAIGQASCNEGWNRLPTYLSPVPGRHARFFWHIATTKRNKPEPKHGLPTSRVPTKHPPQHSHASTRSSWNRCTVSAFY